MKPSYLWGAFVFCFFAPTHGMHTMRGCVADRHQGGTIWSDEKMCYVKLNRDAVACKAYNNYLAGKAEIKSILILTLTQDVGGIIIQTVYFRKHVSEDETLGAAFWFAVLGTMIHLTENIVYGVSIKKASRLRPRLPTAACGDRARTDCADPSYLHRSAFVRDTPSHADDAIPTARCARP